MAATITAERPDTPDAIALITELEDHLAQSYAVESRHGLSVDQLLKQNVAFFVLRADGEPAGCGGIMLVGDEYGEVKRMYVRPQFRGRGYSKLILNHLENYAHEQGIKVARLETGIYQPEAIGLYESTGYKRIPAFADYTDDPVSLCYEKQLS